MIINQNFIDKIDPLLQDKLANAPEDEVLWVIIGLETNEQDDEVNLSPISPADFENRIEYRKALIALRQQELARDIGETKKAIENLVLEVHGGINIPSVVVKGTVNQIFRCLQLSGIKSASLDRNITIDPNPNSTFVNELESVFLEVAEKAKMPTVTNPFARFFGINTSRLEENTKQLITQASQQYAANFNRLYSSLRVLGMKRWVSLESIYTNVRVLPKSEIFCYRSPEELEKIFRKQKENREFYSEDTKTRKGLDLANEAQYLMVLGAPGSGKSTFLKKVALEAFKGRKGDYQHRLIPIFLELKKLTKPSINLFYIIIKEFEFSNFPSAKKYTKIALEEGKCLILLDGLDEIPTKNLESAIEQINKFIKTYYKNHFIISCRTALNKSFDNFTEVVIADFDDQQIKQFISNWFQLETDREAQVAKKCWNLLQEYKNKQAKELAHTPLLLILLCLTYEKSQNFPNNRSTLYSKALRILLEEWAAEKRIHNSEVYRGFDSELETILLSEIAYDNFVKDKLFFKKETIIKQIESFAKENINAPKDLNGEAVLNAIAVQQGILVERARDIYSFSHLTIQEYLTAEYINNHNSIQTLVEKYVTDVRWKEIFLLVAGLMKGGAGKLLLLMEKQALAYLKSPVGKNKLNPLLLWAHNISKDSKSNIPPVAKRWIANANVYTYAYANANVYGNANAYAYAYANAYANANANAYANAKAYANANAKAKANVYVYAYSNAKANANAKAYANAYPNVYVLNKFIDHAQELLKASEEAEVFAKVDFFNLIKQLKGLKNQIPPEEESDEIHQEFAKKIIETWLNAFHLTPELIDLSIEELKEIDKNYFYIYWLMIQCKDAAVKVSPKTWAGIEERMLLPLEENES